jgi:hypothetical protein
VVEDELIEVADPVGLNGKDGVETDG